MIRFYYTVVFLGLFFFCSCGSNSEFKMGNNLYRFDDELAIAARTENGKGQEMQALAVHPVVIDVAKQFHVVADGKTDNSAALQRLNAACKGEEQPCFRFVFPKGELRYTDNSWLSGIDSFEVIAQGTTFRCMAESDWDVAKQPFFSVGLYSTGISKNGKQVHQSGTLFQSVNSGARAIALEKNSETVRFKKGDRVYIAGYEEQMWGYPPNPRFFEWNSIADVDIGQGIIRLNNAIKYRYNSQWKDVDGLLYAAADKHFGKPRIFMLKNYPRYARFVGAIMGNGVHVLPGKTSGFMFPAERLICEGVQFEGQVWPTENRFATYIHCDIAATDLDKNCAVVEFRNCRFRSGVMAATGIDSLALINCVIDDYSALSPRILYAEGNHFTTTTQEPCLYPHPEFTHTDKVYLKNNTFNSVGNKNSVHTFFSEKSEFQVLAIKGSDLVIKDKNDPHSDSMKPIKAIGFGSVIFAKDGSALGTVYDIFHEGTNWIIRLHNVKGKPTSGQIWQYYQTNQVIDLGGNQALDHKPLWKSW